MSELGFTPLHTETGLALPVLIKPEDFTVKHGRQHHKEHPRKRPELQDYAGKALRYSATQQIPNHMHMGKYEGSYHDLFWGIEKLPKTKREKINRAILNLAVIPREAIKLTGDGYELVELDNDDYDLICHPLVTHIEGSNPRKRHYTQQEIGGAVLRYAITEQDLTSLASQSERKSFLSTLDSSREREIGNMIIRRAIDEALRPAFTAYEEAKQNNMANPRKLPLRALVRNFIPEEDFSNYYWLLSKGLQNVEDAPLATLQTEVDAVKLAA